MTYTPIPGQTHDVGSETEVLAMIRTVLTDDDKTVSKRGQEREPTHHPSAQTDKTSARLPRVLGRLKREKEQPDHTEHAIFPGLESQDTVDPSAPTKVGPFMVPADAGVILFGVRIRVRYLAGLAMGLLVYLKPWWFVLGIVVCLAVVLGAVLAFGMERIWQSVVAYLEDMQERDPAKGALWKARLDRFAQRWDQVLDMFPDGSVDALYLPDLQAQADQQARHAAALEDRMSRLSKEAH